MKLRSLLCLWMVWGCVLAPSDAWSQEPTCATAAKCLRLADARTQHNILVIPGTTNPAHLAENLDAWSVLAQKHERRLEPTHIS